MTAETMDYGDLQLTIVSGGTMRIDGGNMFGIIPQVMWERSFAPDSRHRILLDSNCLLVRTSDSLGLIDTGYGDKGSQKFRSRMELANHHPLLRGLQQVGVQAGDLDWVVLSHLHFDHAGGSTLRDRTGALKPAFPNAVHYVQRTEYEDACSAAPELAGAYSTDDFMPLQDAGLLQLVDDSHSVVDGVTTFLTAGHTRGHQSVKITAADQTVIYLADVAPTASHLRTLWSMSYDQFPLTVRRMKRQLLSDIAQQQHTVVLCHDPRLKFTQLAVDDRGDAVPRTPGLESLDSSQ